MRNEEAALHVKAEDLMVVLGGRNASHKEHINSEIKRRRRRTNRIEANQKVLDKTMEKMHFLVIMLHESKLGHSERGNSKH